MTNDQIISKTSDFVKSKFDKESTGHDWWHMYRVWQLAKHIAEMEKDVNVFIVELAALLHDIADWKFNNGDMEAGPRAARSWLESIKVENEIILQVEDIIRNVSFKGAGVKQKMKSKEGQVVSDADKLDALGAIGIARTFAYGGANNRPIYDPLVRPVEHGSFESYKTNQGPTINHFYEKLLLLKDRMYTKTGKKIAARRHTFMKNYLNEFYREWEVKL